MAITKKETTKRINLSQFDGFSSASTEDKKIIKTRVGRFLVDQIGEFLDSSKSPVSGGGYKRTKKNGQPSILSDKGTMRAHIETRDVSANILATGIFDDAPDKENLKSFNHNVGDTLPQRQFIPRPKQKYKKAILSGIKDIISEVINGG